VGQFFIMALDSFIFAKNLQDPIYAAVPSGRCVKLLELGGEIETQTIVVDCKPGDQGAEVHSVAIDDVPAHIVENKLDSLLDEDSLVVAVRDVGHFVLHLNDDDGNRLASMVGFHFPDNALLN
jgi:hypothetical protein